MEIRGSRGDVSTHSIEHVPVRPFPEADLDLADRMRMHRQVVGQLSAAAHFLTMEDYEKIRAAIPMEPTVVRTTILDNDDGVAPGSHFEGDFGGRNA